MRRLRRRVLQALLKKGADKSFNCVTVDSDTSTSDTLLCLRHRRAAAKRRARRSRCRAIRALEDFRAALDDLLIDLAQQVAPRRRRRAQVRDRRRSTGATGAASARRIAMSIANSPLVKTAIAGEDANWGRVVMAVGKAGEPADRDKLAIWFGDIRVAVKGARDPGYDEAKTVGLHEGRRDHDPRRSRPRPWRGHGLDLRPHQGLRGDQRRLPQLTYRLGTTVTLRLIVTRIGPPYWSVPISA